MPESRNSVKEVRRLKKSAAGDGDGSVARGKHAEAMKIAAGAASSTSVGNGNCRTGARLRDYGMR
jgi:hypothetical protein